MGCREHETDHSVFDVHHVERERWGGGPHADGLLTVTWAALVCLVLLLALLQAICRKNTKSDGVKRD